MLGHAGPALQQDFYTIEGLAEKLVGSALIHLEHVPDHRLRPLLHILYESQFIDVLDHGGGLLA